MTINQLIVVVFVLFTPSVCYPCMVKVLPVVEKSKIAESIFVGEIVKVSSMKKPTHLENSYIEIKVSETLKGKVPKKVRVHYFSPKPYIDPNCSAEHMTFSRKTVGMTFLFYVSKHDTLFFTSWKLQGAQVGSMGDGRNLFNDEVAEVKANLGK